MEKVNPFNCKRKEDISMGPSVKFVLAIIDSISNHSLTSPTMLMMIIIIITVTMIVISIVVPVISIVLDHDNLAMTWKHFTLMEPWPRMKVVI